jgi:hypothetical protein
LQVWASHAAAKRKRQAQRSKKASHVLAFLFIQRIGDASPTSHPSRLDAAIRPI